MKQTLWHIQFWIILDYWYLRMRMILRCQGRASWVWDAWHHAGAEHVQLVLVDALMHARIWRRDDLEVLLRLLDDVRWLEKNEAQWSLF